MRHVADFARLLRKRLYPTYREQLKQAVVTAVNDPNNRSVLLSSTGFLISHLLNDGHDRNFLIESLDARFFDKDMKKVGAAVVRSFIDSLSNKRKEYMVCYGIDKFAKHALTGRDNWTINSLNNLPEHVQDQVTIWNDGQYVDFGVRKQLSADAYAAAVLSESDLFRIRSFFVIPSYHLKIDWSKQCVVFRPRGKKIESLVHVDTHLQHPPTEKSDVLGMVMQTSSLHRKMEKDFDTPSNERLNRALALQLLFI